MLVQTFVAELPVEALDVRVLYGLAGPDEREPNAASVRPSVEHLAFELWTMVDGDGGWYGAAISDAIKTRRHTRSGDRGIDLDDEALATEVVDDRQTPQLPPVRESVGNEVHRPALIRCRGLRQRHALKRADAFALA